MNAYEWLINECVPFFANLWTWLTTPLDGGVFGAVIPSELLTPISIFTIGGLGIVLVAKIVALAIPN